MWSKEELGFILYNNRSIRGVVNNFIEPKNPFQILRIEGELDKSKSKFQNDSRMVEFHLDEIDTEAPDILVTRAELEALTQLFNEKVGSFNETEYLYLMNRGIGEKKIGRYSLLGLSNFTEERILEIIGATTHPVLSKIFDSGLSRGGIIIPLFEDEKLVNCAIRRLDSSKALKYSLACPDISVWGLDLSSRGGELWICEGIFDMMALHSTGKRAVSCSSAMWSSIQLDEVLNSKPSSINIFSDNDTTGLRTSAILKDFFLNWGIPTRIFKSSIAKDPAEHFLQKGAKFKDIIEINPTPEDLKHNLDDSFNFVEYLKNREF